MTSMAALRYTRARTTSSAGTNRRCFEGLMPSFLCRFAAFLPILTFISVLAHAQGHTPPHTNLAGNPPWTTAHLGGQRAGRHMGPPAIPAPHRHGDDLQRDYST